VYHDDNIPATAVEKFGKMMGYNGDTYYTGVPWTKLSDGRTPSLPHHSHQKIKTVISNGPWRLRSATIARNHCRRHGGAPARPLCPEFRQWICYYPNLMVVTISFTLAILSDLYIVGAEIGLVLKNAFARLGLVRTWHWRPARPASKLALASREFPLISRPISISHPRITQITARLYSQGESKADKRDERPMMSYSDQPGKHSGHLQTHLRACAAARQAGA
jgi:hypothetical protein